MTQSIARTVNIENIVIPNILTAHVYFWRVPISRQLRMQNEQRRLKEVHDFLYSIGMNIERFDDCAVEAKGWWVGKEVYVYFYYQEGTRKVIKNFHFEVSGKKRNIQTFQKFVEETKQ